MLAELSRRPSANPQLHDSVGATEHTIHSVKCIERTDSRAWLRRWQCSEIVQSRYQLCKIDADAQAVRLFVVLFLASVSLLQHHSSHCFFDDFGLSTQK